jgi:hypothetical protein
VRAYVVNFVLLATLLSGLASHAVGYEGLLTKRVAQSIGVVTPTQTLAIRFKPVRGG